MPAWPGGPCPVCSEEMPANLVHCQMCRALLNSDLASDSVEIPQFIPLTEIESVVESTPRGLYVGCPHCDHELRINRKFFGHQVACKFCNDEFLFDLQEQNLQFVAFYSHCPHCQFELRAAPKYLGEKVVCKKCEGHIQFTQEIGAV